MHSESTCLYYHQLLSAAFDLQRERHGLAGKRGLLVADAFTGNFAKKQGLVWHMSETNCSIYPILQSFALRFVFFVFGKLVVGVAPSIHRPAV